MFMPYFLCNAKVIGCMQDIFSYYGATLYSSGCKNAESLKQEVTVPIVSNNKTCTVKVSLGRHRILNNSEVSGVHLSCAQTSL